jgi:AraC-like DNA-binding protein/predicted enzyme related to lactoylglutathione lyase
MHSHRDEGVSLDVVTRAACLSPFHFHRGFTQAFEQTPHSYLSGLRMERARALLENGTPVLKACVAVGFSSPSAFSPLFRSRIGMLPPAVLRFGRNDCITIRLLVALICGLTAFGQTPPPMRISMISIGVTNMERSVRFYSETLGPTLMGKPGEVTLVLNRPLGSSDGDRLVGAVEIIFPAESVAAMHDLLSKLGCKFLAAPYEVTTGLWAATFSDPDGHKLTMLGPR